jgi:hypothetical protein
LANNFTRTTQPLWNSMGIPKLRAYTLQSRCSWTFVFGISTFRYLPYHTIASTFPDWFRRIEISPRDRQVGFPPCFAISQTTLSSDKLCPLLSWIAFVRYGMTLSLNRFQHTRFMFW